MDIMENVFEAVDRIYLDQMRVGWPGFVKAAISIRFSETRTVLWKLRR